LSARGVEPWLLALADPAGLRAPLPEERLRSGELSQLCRLAERAAVLPAVAANLHEAAGRLGTERLLAAPRPGVSPREEFGAVMADADGRLRRQKVFATWVRRQGDEVLQALAERSLPVTVIRGAAFADRLCPRPSLRFFTDIDLLVPAARLADVEAVMQQLGYVLKVRRRRNPLGQVRAHVWQHPDGGGACVDIHRSLINSPPTRRQVPDLIRATPGWSGRAFVVKWALFPSAAHMRSAYDMHHAWSLTLLYARRLARNLARAAFGRARRQPA
jgi:hypothetical protein